MSTAGRGWLGPVWRLPGWRHRPRPADAAADGPVHGDVLVWVLRRDYPDGGHDFALPRGDRPAVVREVDRDWRYWAGGPVRPRLGVAQLSWRDLLVHDQHRRGCRAPDCPPGQPADSSRDKAVSR